MTNIKNASNYRSTLEYLYEHLPMYHRIGNEAFKKDLTNIRALCESLGNPQDSFKTIHIGGTNGKGSTSHMVAALLQSHGLKTGLYVSPHYKDFRERIKVDGHLISKKFVVAFTERIKPLIEQLNPSFFEITVAMAFTYFKESRIDVGVIEVGLGGRLDSTNIIKPIVAGITQISWDHMNMLGNTLQEIAFEKAGIMKVNTPCIIGEFQEDLHNIFERKAKELPCPLILANSISNFDVFDVKMNSMRIGLHYSDRLATQPIDLPFGPVYQLKNLNTALAIFTTFCKNEKIKTCAEKVENGLVNLHTLTNFIGRWHKLKDNPLVIVESAHNEGGLKQVKEHLEKFRTQYKKVHLVVGFVKDKDVEKSLLSLPPADHCYFVQANIPRAFPAIELKGLALKLGIHGKNYRTVKGAKKAVLKAAKPDDLVLVLGSIFVAGEFL